VGAVASALLPLFAAAGLLMSKTDALQVLVDVRAVGAMVCMAVGVGLLIRDHHRLQ
jgi:hypothetical protein